MKQKRKTTRRSPTRVDVLAEALKHSFDNREYLERALIHRSFAHEKGTPGHDSEALEFLGDAVLSLGVSRMLHDKFPEAEVGDLARTRAFLVSEKNLARKARTLDLGRYLRLGRGEERGGGRDKDSLLADVYEAVLAAIYLDGGVDAAMSAIVRHFNQQIYRLKPGSRSAQDYKTDLQEALQAVGLPVPEYRVAGETGPDHRKSFAIDLVIAGRKVASGNGTSKKAAEQMGARDALNSLGKLLPQLTGSDRKAPAAPPRGP